MVVKVRDRHRVGRHLQVPQCDYFPYSTDPFVGKTRSQEARRRKKAKNGKKPQKSQEDAVSVNRQAWSRRKQAHDGLSSASSSCTSPSSTEKYTKEETHYLTRPAAEFCLEKGSVESFLLAMEQMFSAMVTTFHICGLQLIS